LHAVVDDPLVSAIAIDAHIGMLGIELATRRRNRMNGKIVSTGADHEFTLQVDLSFGNCPKYIQARDLVIPSGLDTVNAMQRWISENSKCIATYKGSLRPEHIELIKGSDTFFVASSFAGDSSSRSAGDAAHGVDVSHRGGRSGFAQVTHDGSSLMWPDFLGNFFFNTLGNILKNPNCGLLFYDFDSNVSIQLNGVAEVIFDAEDMPPGAQRLVRFAVRQVRVVSNAMPFTWKFLGVSPYSPVNSMVGAPPGTNPKTGLVGLRLQILESIQETHDTKTYTLGGAGIALTAHQLPGQYASFTIDDDEDEEESGMNPGSDDVRTWTISSAPSGPSDYTMQITVRRKVGGSVANQLFDGQIHFLKLTGISGSFHLPQNASQHLPLLFIAGGVGITPLMSMLRGLAKQRSPFNVHLLYSVHSAGDVIFKQELEALIRALSTQLRVSLWLTRADETDESLANIFANVIYRERITARKIAEVVPDVAQRQVYLCGPVTFMTVLEEELVNHLGVSPFNIHSEKFDY
jgi:ferredoxin-NADP reductase/predicted pyridoxine 5'-phosphate oxidase superfamily flavin-nucleotide-binding protein